VRVSVTDRCDFRCVYCMSEDMTFLPKPDVLSLEELDRLCSAFVRMGTRKLRVTGGEPLVRRGIMTLFRSLSRHLDSGALDELTLTTNGSQLARFAGELADCGVRRINVSLDTLDPDKFRAVTRWGDFDKVMAGIDAADAAGLRSRSTRWRSRVSTTARRPTSSPGRMAAASTSPSSRSCRSARSSATGSTSSCR
jgi:cyclic pyranopterin phosphate synthase